MIVVHNSSSKVIENLNVEVCGRIYNFRNIEPKIRVKTACVIDSESTINVSGNFSNGKKIKGSFGYVSTGCYTMANTIIINETGSVIGFQ